MRRNDHLSTNRMSVESIKNREAAQASPDQKWESRKEAAVKMAETQGGPEKAAEIREKLAALPEGIRESAMDQIESALAEGKFKTAKVDGEKNRVNYALLSGEYHVA